MRILALVAVVVLLTAPDFAVGLSAQAGHASVTASAAFDPTGRASDARTSGTGQASQPTYRAPVTGALRVLVPFQPPPTPYSAGHRGVDLAVAQSSVIVAAGTGMVRFAGSVAGRGVVVIQHPDGISTEYEPVRATVAVGAAVIAGEPIGRLAGRHEACGPSDCLHWGARRGEVYLDPMSLLRPLGPVRLVP
jgi:murein DD-endopeptidase MepM/ murein hydrolase activator NlpD